MGIKEEIEIGVEIEIEIGVEIEIVIDIEIEIVEGRRGRILISHTDFHCLESER